MSLSKKYGIPEDKIRALIRDGWLSCTVSKYEEVIHCYKKNISNGIDKMDAISNTAEEMGISDRHVYRIIHKFD